MRINKIWIIFISVFIFGACNNSEKKSTNLDEIIYKEQKVRVIYRIPSPIEIFNLLQNAKLEFHDSVLNPLGNWENYNVLKSQTLNLGIYSADLAYTAAYEQYQESLLYFSLIRKLGQKVGISAVFSEEMTNRVQNNLSNSDSLGNISVAYYRGMIDYLAENEKTTELALIYTGGWIETLYILCNTIGNVDDNSFLMDQLAEQKFLAENLDLLLKMDIKKADISTTYNEVKPILDIFENLELTSSEELQVANINDEIVVKGGIVYTFEKKQCADLKQKVNSLRMQWIQK